MNTHFVTGLHRAGTHSYAEYLAKENDCEYVEEAQIKWDNFEKAIELAKPNTVIHCPALAHRCIDLSKHAKVYWVTRNKRDVVTSMRNANIGVLAWRFMKAFKAQFPNDEIWDTLKYDGSNDAKQSFVGYFDILVDVKEYFCEKYFKDISARIETEDQPYYDFENTRTSKNPLKEIDIESIRLCKT